MTKVRFTYRPTQALFEKVAEEANKKGISINAEINNILYEYYFNAKERKEDKTVAAK